jgi:hypothetical protein
MTMTTGGWVFMIVAWAAILWLIGHCLIKVLTKKKPG